MVMGSGCLPVRCGFESRPSRLGRCAKREQLPDKGVRWRFKPFSVHLILMALKCCWWHDCFVINQAWVRDPVEPLSVHDTLFTYSVISTLTIGFDSLRLAVKWLEVR